MSAVVLSRFRLTLVAAVILLFSVALTLPRTAPVSAAPGINQELNFQGRLLNAQGATVPDGFYNIQFKIYQDGTGTAAGNPGGTLEWTESHLGSAGNGIQVKNGFMSVQLGSVTPFGSSVDWNQNTLWLSMNIGGTSTTCTPFANCTPDGEMVPMKRLSANPYAINSSQLGGLTSGQFLQLAQGVQTDTSTNTASIHLNKTGSGNFMLFQNAGSDVLSITNSGDINFGANANHTVSIANTASGVTGRTLTVAAGSSSTGGAGAAGGNLMLQGGNAGGSGNFNGGGIFLAGGAGVGTGVQGLVNLGASAYTPAVNTPCTADCTISQSFVDSYGTVIITASTPDISIFLPPPTLTSTTGRIIYITTASGSQDFTLRVNSGADLISVAMRQNTTATMIWNGTAWTPGGASNATTLQATYANGTNPATTPEIKLDSIRGTIDIQDADTSIGTDIFNIRGSNPAGLGTVLFGVSNTGRVTIQDTSDQSSSFRVLNSAGNYLFNINSSNNYVLSNSITTPGNLIANPHFETGGLAQGGEEGWFSPAQASIVNNNFRNGNFALAVNANGTSLDSFAGNFYEVLPGDGLYFEGYVKNSAGANGTGGIRIQWYDKDKNPTGTPVADAATLPGTSYVLKKVSTTVPAGAFYARVSAIVNTAATTGTYYFDDFYFKNSTEIADMSFRNTNNSTAAFRIQSAGSSQTLFTANTTDNILKVGDNTGSDTSTTLLVLDSATANPTTNLAVKNGALFYRSDTNSLKAVVGGTVVDICTTAVTCSGYSGSAGSTVQLQGSSPGSAQTGNFNITGTGILTQLQTMDLASGNTSALTVRTGNASSGSSGNLIIDTGTAAGGSRGTITIGQGAVAVTLGGSLNIQGGNSLALGTSSVANGSILFRNNQGSNTISLTAPGANPASSYTLTLPQNLGSSGDCLKDNGGGALGFGNCAAGITVSLQDAYNNSSSPASILLANAKNFEINAQDTSSDPSIVFNLQCVSSCATGTGRFVIQNGAGNDALTVLPNNGGIILGKTTQIGSATNDATQVNLQLDRSTNESLTCIDGAMYYNSSMGAIRTCIDSVWNDISNPEPLGLMSFGVVPASGPPTQAYDLASTIDPGVSGPCKVYWASNSTISWQPCVAYSGGSRVVVAGANGVSIGTAGENPINSWRHLCLEGIGSQPVLTTANASQTADMPPFNPSEPILCLADIQISSTTAGRIGNIYDTRTFTSSMKEAVPASTAVALGMLVDSNGTNGAMVPGGSASGKLYGLVAATNGATTVNGEPNAIITAFGPGWVKAVSGTAGQFVRTNGSGFGTTIASVPNNSFYYSAGNTRTSFANGCTSAATCTGSLYVNFNVR